MNRFLGHFRFATTPPNDRSELIVIRKKSQRIGSIITMTLSFHYSEDPFFSLLFIHYISQYLVPIFCRFPQRILSPYASAVIRTRCGFNAILNSDFLLCKTLSSKAMLLAMRTVDGVEYGIGTSASQRTE